MEHVMQYNGAQWSTMERVMQYNRFNGTCDVIQWSTVKQVI